MFKKAVKRNAKLRFGVAGPAGSGKTFTLLRLATLLGGRIAYVDTEHGSASKYAHTDTCGGPGVCGDKSHFDFDVVEPTSYDPMEMIEFISYAVANGYGSVCGDSLSHYWTGTGGELDQVDAAAKKIQGNSFAAWKTVTPIHNKLVDTMLTAPIHVLVAMRSKTEWVIEKNDKGQSVPRKIGLAPIMRDGIEFEFDVFGDMDQDNNLVITKSRCSAISGKVFMKPGEDLAAPLVEWLAGAPIPELVKPPEPEPIPGPLVGIFSSLNRPGAVADGFGQLRAQLIEAKPETGAEEYLIVLEKCGVKKKGNTIAIVQAAMLALWKTADEARRAALVSPVVTDADLPDFTPEAKSATSNAPEAAGQFEDGWITEDEPKEAAFDTVANK